MKNETTIERTYRMANYDLYCPYPKPKKSKVYKRKIVPGFRSTDTKSKPTEP